MRTRNPCVFLRWVVDGWKVRFMASPALDADGEKPEIITDDARAHHRRSPRKAIRPVDNTARSR
jgi:hypothetical protein